MNKNPSPATRFQPGQTGNPKGSSRKAQDRAEFTAALTKLLAEKGAAGKFLQAGWDAALAGDFQFWRYLWERLEGKTVTPEPGPQICLEDIALAMKAKHDKLMLDRDLTAHKIALADQKLSGPGEKLDLETIAREMKAEDERLDRERSGEASPRCGLVELPAPQGEPPPCGREPAPPPPPPLPELPKIIGRGEFATESPGPEPDTRPYLDFGGFAFYPQE